MLRDWTSPSFALIAAIAVSVPASADDQSTVTPLWRDINAGDTIEQVATKLAAAPGIKSAKAKREKVDINYVSDDGIEIFGASFAVVPAFVDGRLKQLALVRRPDCLGSDAELYDQVMSVLREKYPGSPFPDYEITPARFSDALIRATADQPSTLGIVRYSDNTAVLFNQTITRFQEPPSTPIGATKTMRAVGDYLWSDYQRHLDECPRQGAYRIAYAIIYMTRDDFDSVSQDVINDATANAEQSRKNL